MRYLGIKALTAVAAVSAVAASQSLSPGIPPVDTGYMIQQLATLLPDPAPDSLQPDPYWDVQKSRSALWNDISFMQDNGWLTNIPTLGSYTFGASTPFTRSEAAAVVARMYALPVGHAGAYDTLMKIGAFQGLSLNRGTFTASDATLFIQRIRTEAQRLGWHIALSPQGNMDLKNPHLATQAGMAAGLLDTFSTLSVWPKSLSMSAPFSASAWIPPSPRAWIGLKAVFPGQPSQRYAALLGISPTNPTGSVTAAQIAKWISNWAVTARRVNLKTSVSQSPYEWAKTFSIFYGTSVNSPATVLTTADAQRILTNVVDAALGFRVLGANRISFLAPIMTLGKPGTVPNSMYNTVVTVLRQLQAHTGHLYTWSDWPELYKEAVNIQDSTDVTLTPDGALYSRRASKNFGVGSNFQWVSSEGVVTGEWNQTMTAINSGNPSALFGLHYPVAIDSHTFYDGAAPEKESKPGIPGSQMLSYTSDPFSSATSPYFGVLLRGPSYQVFFKGGVILKVSSGPSFLSNSISLRTDYPAWSANQLG